MATSLTFLCAGATASSRAAGFPSPSEPLDRGGRDKVATFRLPRTTYDRIMTSPSRAAIETADILGLHAATEPALADRDFGEWTGRTLPDVERDAGAALMNWLREPTRAAPGGEPAADLAARIGDWIDRQAAAGQTSLVISHASVMRATIAHCLDIAVAATMRVDIAPLSTLSLSFERQWRLQELRRAR